MNSQLSSKFVAIAVAIAINGTMIGAVAVLFGNRAHAQIAALAHVSSALGFLA